MSQAGLDLRTPSAPTAPALPPTFRRWQSAAYGPPSVLSLQECKTADFLPRKGELLLRVLATDATYTDLLVVAGNYPNPAVKRLPVCPGYDCAAEVAAVGEGVAAGAFSVGDVVISMPLCGCCAEFVRVDARHAVRVAAAAGAAFVRARPEVAASLALTGATAYQMLHRVVGPKRLAQPDAALLVHAASGGTGAMLVQLAKLAGVSPQRIVGTCSKANLESVRALGVHAVAYDDSEGGGWAAKARAAVGGAGFSAVCDSVCTSDYFSKGISLLRSGGVYVAIGFTDKANPGVISTWTALPTVLMLLFRSAILHSIFGLSNAVFYLVNEERDKRPAAFGEDMAALVELAASGKLEVVVGKTWDFEEASSALKSIAAGSHRGKQMIRVAAP